jgi:serine/threonine-protein kinase
MAPEQLRNEPLDRRTDVWALGTVLWETLAQRHLFKRDTEFLTFQAITHEPIPNICEVRPDVAPLLGDVIARALSRNRDDRFGSARALGEALAQSVAPLGGAANSAAISEEVQAAFAAQLAEQNTLLRIAREGGQFDLETSSPLVGHGTAIATTPASSLKRRVDEARAEVAQFVAAQQAIDSLADESSNPGWGRAQSEGAFTPAPSRRTSRPMAAQPAPRRTSQPMAAQRISSAMPAQSGPYAVAPAEWTAAEVTPPPPLPPTRPFVIEKSSRLPWIIATVAVLAAGCAGVLLYLNLSKQKAPPPAGPTKEVAMANTAPVIADAAVAPAVVPPSDAAVVAPPVDAAEVTPPPPPVKPVAHPHPQPVHVAVVEKEKPSGPPGFITIDSAPVYAVIYIDGKKYGDTPLVKISLPPGKHSVRAVSPSGASKNVAISIESGKTAPVRKIEW